MLGVKWFPFLFYLQISFSGKQRERECVSEIAPARTERERESPLPATHELRLRRRPRSFDFAGDPETSRHKPRSPFDFDFESHPNHTLWLRRRTQRPGSHTFDFADFAPFNFADFARLRLRWDGTETTPIALRSRLRNGWVLMNLTGFDELFLVGFWWIWPDLCLSIEKWYYIFVWELKKCEK